MEGHTKAALCLLSFGADPHKINPLHNCSALGYAWENGLVAVQLAITNEMHTKPKKRSRSSFYPNYTKRGIVLPYVLFTLQNWRDCISGMSLVLFCQMVLQIRSQLVYWTVLPTL